MSLCIDFLKSLAHELTEVRILRSNRYMPLSGKREYVGETVSGYYTPDAYPKLIEDIVPFEGDADTKGIYITLQCADPALHARAENRLRFNARETTSDDWITHFTVFPIDVDSANPSGTSASKAELDASKQEADRIACFLKQLGIPYVPAMSGNGWHILIYVHLLENTPENAARWKAVGDLVAARFGSDVKNYNPSRVWKLYGTTAKKGDSTEERPHRVSTIWLPNEIQRISFDTLEAELTEALPQTDPESTPKSTKSQPNSNRTLREWLDDHNIRYTEKPYKGTFKYQVDCPHDPSHKSPDAWITDEGGTWQFSCSHDSCQGERSTWRAYKNAHGIEDEPKQHGGRRQGTGRKSNAEKSAEVEVPDENNGKPVVMLNEVQTLAGEPTILERSRELVSDDVVQHLWKKKNDVKPRIYRRGTELGTLRSSGDTLQFTKSERDSMQGEISRVCSLMKIVDGKIVTVANPQQWIADDVLKNQDIDGVPEVKVIVTHPFWNGETLVFKTGYDAATHVYLSIDENVSYDLDIEKHTPEADVQLWRDLLTDFPFRSEADFENALAFALTLIIRQGLDIGEAVPLGDITAPREGVGKSLLAETLTAAVTGAQPRTRSLGSTKEEIEKGVGAALRGAPEVVIFDNVDPDKKLDSGTLASVVTQPNRAFRILGVSDEMFYENRACLVYTGSNVEVSPELAKRLMAVRLYDTGVAEKDRKVKVEGILKHVIDRHIELVSSLLRMVQRWIDGGSETGTENFHRMRQWSRVIHSILATNGVDDNFMKNYDEVMLQANPEFTMWANGFKAILDQLGTEKATAGFTVKEVFTILSYKEKVYGKPEDEGGLGKGFTTDAEGDNLLGELIGDCKSDKARAIKLGKLMRAKVGSVFASWELVDTHSSDRDRTKIYALKWRGEKSNDTQDNEKSVIEKVLDVLHGQAISEIDFNEITKLAGLSETEAGELIEEFLSTGKLVPRLQSGKQYYFKPDDLPDESSGKVPF